MGRRQESVTPVTSILVTLTTLANLRRFCDDSACYKNGYVNDFCPYPSFPLSRNQVLIYLEAPPESLSIMIVKSYVFDYPLSTRHKGPSNQILKMTGKKYTTNFSENEGLTLLFAHCVGSRELR